MFFFYRLLHIAPLQTGETACSFKLFTIVSYDSDLKRKDFLQSEVQIWP